ncbi:MAG: carbamoyltransferase HypF [Nitrospirae bacterium]|nr:carbamoyltransferase HypF [Nitrospirota bacterium]
MSKHQGKECLSIIIKGIVQGVGFRPFVYNLATELKVTGFVSNTSEGVIITAEGDNLPRFIERIKQEAPPHSKIMKMDVAPAEPGGFTEFRIVQSSDSGSFTLISPDISTCDACCRELFDRSDRRYLYPFINCTNCGPRYSITRAVPYDRKNTTMQGFVLCEQCSSEYHNPRDRRFHAQPNACPVCGPEVRLLDSSGKDIESVEPINEAIELLKAGKIIALKGLGGFHIACDALNAKAVERLRTEKRKSNKPFALMAPNMESIRRHCVVSSDEEELLCSFQRPIVILRKKEGTNLPLAVSPGNASLGFMLPNTPLHHLLFRYPLTDDSSPITHHCFSALIMTSGNISEEPIIISNKEAVKKLSGIADVFLVHNRDIFMRVDDSVMRVRKKPAAVRHAGVINSITDVSSLSLAPDSVPCMLRRSRGYVPEPIPLLTDGPDLLGCGADMKNTFTLLRGKYAIVSQHMGDMENYETVCFFEETLENLKTVYRAEPVAVVHDLHPNYFSSDWALVYGKKQNLKTIAIQHHYAHIGSVMAEHGLTCKVIGVAFDGSGYGEDGTLWGGEFLVADTRGFRRAGHLRQVPLPGGEQAIREPWRIALSYLRDAFGSDLTQFLGPIGFIEKYGMKKISDILQITDKRNFSPLSSGAGRLFDAVSALIGVCDMNTFEGEASIALESMALKGIEEDYPVDIHLDDRIIIDFAHTFIALVDDLNRNVDKGIMSAKFHNTVAMAIIRVVLKLSLMNNIKTVALSGGVFQNLYLLEKVAAGLREEGLTLYTNEKVPCNDAGISLGQVFLARELMKAGISS